jgi:hypothetical protein
MYAQPIMVGGSFETFSSSIVFQHFCFEKVFLPRVQYSCK